MLKAAIGQIRQDYAFSERRACGVMTMAVSSYRYETRRTDEPLRTRLVELAREKPRFGYRRLHVLLGRSGEHVNHSGGFCLSKVPGLRVLCYVALPAANRFSTVAVCCTSLICRQLNITNLLQPVDGLVTTALVACD